MPAKPSRDSTVGVSHDIFCRIQDSFTTQATRAETAQIPVEGGFSPAREGAARGGLKPCSAPRVRLGLRSLLMPYALFSNDAKLSKAYPTEADVWKHARKSGLVVDAATEEDKAAPRPVLDNDYEIKPCPPDPQEDPDKNQADAEREEELDLQLDQ
jgi:hypothetical protein